MWKSNCSWAWRGKWRKKHRRINFDFDSTIFKPAWVPIDELETIDLQEDELEVLRLKNMQWVWIIEWAEIMWISKSTFARIYNQAVSKLADALVNNKAIVKNKV